MRLKEFLNVISYNEYKDIAINTKDGYISIFWLYGLFYELYVNRVSDRHIKQISVKNTTNGIKLFIDII